MSAAVWAAAELLDEKPPCWLGGEGSTEVAHPR